MTVGPDDTEDALTAFISERLNFKETESIIRLWTGMLLEPRFGVLAGMEKPSQQQIDDHAIVATDFLLAAERGS